MTKYSIIFKNETPHTAWDFVVYKAAPPGLASIAWLACPVNAQGQCQQDFTLTYGVALTEKVGGVWTITQMQQVELANKYEVKIASDSGVPYNIIDPKPIGVTEKDQISVWNNTSKMLDLGVTLSGELLLVQEAVPPNTMALFLMSSPYNIVLTKSVRKGQVMNAPGPLDWLGPVQLQYTDSYTKAEVSVVQNDEGEKLQKPKLIG